MHLYNCGFPEPCLIWLLLCWDVPYGICDISATIATVMIRWSNVVSPGATATASKWGVRTAWTFNSAILLFISLSWRMWAMSPYPGYINSTRIICFCQILPMCCGTALEIAPITQSVSSSLLSLLCSVSSSLFCHLPHLTDCGNLKYHSDLLWYHSTPRQMCFQAIRMSIPRISHFSYLPPDACSLYLNGQQDCLRWRFLYLHNPRLIELSLSWLKCAFPIISPVQASC